MLQHIEMKGRHMERQFTEVKTNCYVLYQNLINSPFRLVTSFALFGLHVL